MMAERDPYAQRVLRRHWPDVPVVDDVRVVGSEWRGRVGGVFGGPPCQAASSAGKQRGEADERWLWPEAVRVVREVEPDWAFFENVTGLLTLRGGESFREVLRAFMGLGYVVRWDCAEAAAVGAPHLRDRVWISCTRGEAGPRPWMAVPVDQVRAWPRAGWASGGRVGEERARWPKVGRGGGGVWATPRAGDWRSGRVSDEVFNKNSRPLCEEVTRAEAERGRLVPEGRLNPDWVEWIMGWPTGWTSPEGPSLRGAPDPSWDTEPCARLTTDKENRRDRLRCIGNGVVSACARVTFAHL